MNKTILIIEDEPALVFALTSTFTKEGFETVVASDGKEGLDIAVKTHPDIILLDILMPVMDGMTMLGELRKDPWGKDAKVIILTNLSDHADEAKSTEQGVQEYLIKSNLALTEVVAKVNKMLGINTNTAV